MNGSNFRYGENQARKGIGLGEEAYGVILDSGGREGLPGNMWAEMRGGTGRDREITSRSGGQVLVRAGAAEC